MRTRTTEDFQLVTSSDGRFLFRIPDEDELSQDREWVSVQNGEGWKTLRLHDYERIYRTPGLYEALVYDVLRCRSPRRLVRLFTQVLDNWPDEPRDLRVLDLGAGNGIVGERLRQAGVDRVVGLDILPEAAAAAERDRPEVYADYVVADLTEPDGATMERIRRHEPNALVTVAALGFGDIPPAAFRTAFNAIGTPGWLALTIKEDFLDVEDGSGFSRLLHEMMAGGILHEQARLRIRHRVSVAGEPLFYVGLVARKLEDIPEGLVQ